MSGPYPPPGYPHPQDQGGWWPGQPGPYGGNPGNQYPGRQSPPNPHGQYGPPPYDVANDFPTVEYSGLATQSGGWGPPPPKKRNTGRIVVAVVAILVIIGGVATGIVLLNQRHTQQQAAPPAPTSGTAPTSTGGQLQTTAQAPTTADTDTGQPNGSSTLTLTAGACVTAQVSADEQYTAVRKVTCGTAQSDLVLAMTSAAMTGCANHQYLRLTAPNTGVYCFTLDVKQGDCVDNSYLKAPCTTAPFVVLRTEAGPGSASSCMDATGATHWVPVGRDPVKVGCLGPTKNS